LFGWRFIDQTTSLFFQNKSAPATSYHQVSNIFLSQQISTSHQNRHQPPATNESAVFFSHNKLACKGHARRLKLLLFENFIVCRMCKKCPGCSNNNKKCRGCLEEKL
jgi:hypothetical protein